MALSPVGDLGIALKADVDDYQKSMATASDITSGLTGLFRNLSRAVRNLGVVMTGASAIAGAAMVGLSRKAGRVSEAFREVDTISRSVRDAQAEYGEVVSDINTNLGLQASQLDVIEGLYQSVSAGIEEGAESQREFLTVAGRLAVVGRVDLAETVDLLSTVLNTYNLSVEKAEDVSRTLFSTVQFGKVRMEELTPVMGRVAALGSNMDVTIDQLGASMAVLTRRGFDARIAATGLRNILRAMLKPSDQMKQSLRNLALENEEITRQWQQQSNTDLPNVAQAYQEAEQAVRELEEAQASLRREQQEASLAIQRARLAITAIEEERVDQLEDSKAAAMAENNTIEELQQTIEDYRFELNEARVQEEEARLQQEDHKETVQELREDFRKNVDMAGDLEDGIGQLVIQNEGLVDTLTKLRDRAEENNIQMSELFPRTRALQAALALVNDDGELLNEIFTIMRDEGEVTEEQISSLAEKFDDMSEEDLRKAISEMQDMGGLMEEVRGPTQDLRDATSELSEAAVDLGKVFEEETIGALEDFAGAIRTAVDRVDSLDESTKDAIARFGILGSTLGLTLGPVLFFGGQLALIAQAMGVGLIPMLGTTAAMLGVLGFGFQKALEGGEESEQMFRSLKQIIDGIQTTVGTLVNIFVQEILPGLIDFGEGLVAVFIAVFNELTGRVEDAEGSTRSFASVIGDAFSVMGQFLKDNAQNIADFVGLVIDGFLAIPMAVQKAISFMKTFGQKGQDGFNNIVSVIQSDVIPTVQDIIKFFGDKLVNEVIPALKDFGSFIKGKVVPPLKTFGQFLVDEVKPAAESMKDGILDVASSIIESIQELASEIDTVSLAVTILDIVKALSDFVETVGEFLSENDKLIADIIVTATIFAGLVGPITKVVGALFTIGQAIAPILSAKTAVGALSAAVAALGGPVVVIGAIIAALAAAWITDFGGIRSATMPLIDALVDMGKTVMDELLPPIMNLIDEAVEWGKAFMDLLGFLQDVSGGSFALGMAIESLGLLFDGLVGAIGDVINIIAELARVIRLSLQFLVQFFSSGKVSEELRKNLIGALQALYDAIISLFVNLGKAVVGLLGSIFGTILGIFMDISSGILRVLGGLVDRIISWGVDLFNALIEPFVDVKNAVIGNSIIPEMIDDIVTALGNLPSKILEKLSNFVSDVTQPFKDLAKDIVGGEESSGIIGGLISDVKSPFGSLGQVIINKLSGFIETVTGPFSDLKSDLVGDDGVSGTVGGMVDSIIGFFTSLPGDIVSAISGNLVKIAQAFMSGGKVYKTIVGLMGGIVDDIITFFANLPGNIVDAIKNNIPGAEGLFEWLEDPLDGVLSTVDDILSNLQTIANTTWNTVVDIAMQLIDNVPGSDILGDVSEGFKRNVLGRDETTDEEFRQTLENIESNGGLLGNQSGNGFGFFGSQRPPQETNVQEGAVNVTINGIIPEELKEETEETVQKTLEEVLEDQEAAGRNTGIR